MQIFNHPQREARPGRRILTVDDVDNAKFSEDHLKEYNVDEMKRVLILDNDEDIQTILAARIGMQFQAETVALPQREAMTALKESEFSLVISDVEDSEEEGFWLHRWLLNHYPTTGLVLFVSPDRMLRNIPQGLDSVLRGMVLKFDFSSLDREIEKSGILGPRKLRNLPVVAPGLEGGLKC